MGIFGSIRAGLARTTRDLVARFDEIVRRADSPQRRTRPIDVETTEALEELLIAADVGVSATQRIIEAVAGRTLAADSLKDVVKREIRAILTGPADRPVVTGAPTVVLVVGVNGTGKTTTVGKLANLLKAGGQAPVICAADT